MFDVSLGELTLIGVVALVVIGPEKLPKVARTAGLLLGRARRYMADIRADMDRELRNAELAALQEQVQTEVDDLQQEVRQTLRPALDDYYGEETLAASGAQVAAEPADAPISEQALIEQALQPDLFASPPAQVAEKDWRDRR